MRSHAASAALAGALILATAGVGALPAWCKSPFTVTNDPFPVEKTVVNTMMKLTCTGLVSQPWGGPEGGHFEVRANWVRKPDGTAWIEFYWAGNGPLYIPVTELGVSAQWN